MKNYKLPLLSLIGLLGMSACLQAESTRVTSARATSAGPQSIISSGDQSKVVPATANCSDTPEKKDALSKLNEGADALFQILTTDPNDLTTVHSRAYALLDLESEYSRNFIESCLADGQTTSGMALEIDKTTGLSKETDSSVIHALAKDLWDLFNPNISISSDGGVSSPNPFAEPANP
jgi:hypothetical protein